MLIASVPAGMVRVAVASFQRWVVEAVGWDTVAPVRSSLAVSPEVRVRVISLGAGLVRSRVRMLPVLPSVAV